ncbi:hypothetical protein PUNSTDRAFT_117212 [Punctularia strigosozonata HHB-11173 SS5]|uniref:uncharacterized protein n=1 Tax=Punctularia strigosozonata (strain HHB-11173) TaxID=741275 RepID=UPI0004417E71|nr:uncharacterized protein PUNSTDRAFT_117212 [Punctularia strigosozonata HHB-11173 SS5]EIN13431.1 hypothetical protein PUNSTDRAFT_117212 [Punctularia strigosozonata HHB-11173 SS5]
MPSILSFPNFSKSRLSLGSKRSKRQSLTPSVATSVSTISTAESQVIQLAGLTTPSSRMTSIQEQDTAASHDGHYVAEMLDDDDQAWGPPSRRKRKTRSKY